MRTIKNIINDYIFYYNFLLSQGRKEFRKEQLFSLMIYKNLRPEDFSKLQFKEGVLANWFKVFKEKKFDKIKEIRADIEKAKMIIENSKKLIVNDIEQLKNMIIGYVVKKNDGLLNSYYSNQNCQWYNTINNIGSFENSQSNTVIGQIGNSYKNILLSDAEEDLLKGKTFLELEHEIKVLHDNSSNFLEIDEKNTLVQQIESYNVIEYSKKYNDFIIEDSLISLLINNDFIDESYIDLISIFKSNIIMTNNDNEFIMSVYANNEIDESYEIDNVPFVINEAVSPNFTIFHLLNLQQPPQFLHLAAQINSQFVKAGHYNLWGIILYLLVFNLFISVNG